MEAAAGRFHEVLLYGKATGRSADERRCLQVSVRTGNRSALGMETLCKYSHNRARAASHFLLLSLCNLESNSRYVWKGGGARIRLVEVPSMSSSQI